MNGPTVIGIALNLLNFGNFPTAVAPTETLTMGTHWRFLCDHMPKLYCVYVAKFVPISLPNRTMDRPTIRSAHSECIWPICDERPLIYRNLFFIYNYENKNRMKIKSWTMHAFIIIKKSLQIWTGVWNKNLENNKFVTIKRMAIVRMKEKYPRMNLKSMAITKWNGFTHRQEILVCRIWRFHWFRAQSHALVAALWWVAVVAKFRDSPRIVVRWHDNSQHVCPSIEFRASIGLWCHHSNKTKHTQSKEKKTVNVSRDQL